MLSMFEAKTAGLFVVTAIAEIVGCYLPLLWFRNLAPAWVLIPAALSLGLFVWLLSLHPFASGRINAAYGGVYVATALGWLWLVDGIRPTLWDLTGIAVTLIGMGVIAFRPSACITPRSTGRAHAGLVLRGRVGGGAPVSSDVSAHGIDGKVKG